ncbi:MAG: hypothetical protein ACFFBS_00470 [Promethearchaeota archaeon]
MRLERLFPAGIILILIGFLIILLASMPPEGVGILIFPFFFFTSGDGLVLIIGIVALAIFIGVPIFLLFYIPKRKFRIEESESFEQPEDPTETKYCIACGTILPEKARYCWRCGSIQSNYPIKENGEQ